MAEDTARALGAGDLESVTIAGKECTPRPLTLVELGELERYCLRQWRKEVLETYWDGLQVIEDPDDRMSRYESKMEQISGLGVDEMPLRWAYDWRSLVINKKVEKWLKKEYPSFDVDKADDTRKKRWLASALDREKMTAEEYRDITGADPVRQRIPYPSWWLTGTNDGMIALIHRCFRDQVSRSEVAEAMVRTPDVFVTTVSMIEELTTPQPKNG